MIPDSVEFWVNGEKLGGLLEQLGSEIAFCNLRRLSPTCIIANNMD